MSVPATAAIDLPVLPAIPIPAPRGFALPRVPRLVGQLARFGTVGGLGLVVDVTVFNLLRADAFAGLAEGPLLAKVVSTTTAIGVNWIGNRYWAFREHRRTAAWREGLSFLAVSLLGMGVALGCLFVSHDLLGLTSVAADNVSSNVVGLLLGTAVRFALYRWWVYRPQR